jgi:hypothetical protein
MPPILASRELINVARVEKGPCSCNQCCQVWRFRTRFGVFVFFKLFLGDIFIILTQNWKMLVHIADTVDNNGKPYLHLLN